MVFQSFVFMCIFNEINSRKLGASEFNVFAGICGNYVFVFITLLTLVVQCVLCQFGGVSVRCTPLSNYHNLVCLAIGFGSIIWGFITKMIIPPALFRCFVRSEKPMTRVERQDSLVGSFKKSRIGRSQDKFAIN